MEWWCGEMPRKTLLTTTASPSPPGSLVIIIIFKLGDSRCDGKQSKDNEPLEGEERQRRQILCHETRDSNSDLLSQITGQEQDSPRLICIFMMRFVSFVSAWPYQI